ncbi:retrotransposon unclassified [Hordeum vulgare]|nr:retrotransposon unclassified [Hordeum vulgare]
MKATWNPAQAVVWRRIKANLFSIQFSCLADWNKAMHQGPWDFHRMALLMTEYDGFTNPEKVKLDRLETWCQIHRLPDGVLKSKSALQNLASRVGSVEEVQVTLPNGFIGRRGRGGGRGGRGPTERRKDGEEHHDGRGRGPGRGFGRGRDNNMQFDHADLRDGDKNLTPWRYNYNRVQGTDDEVMEGEEMALASAQNARVDVEAENILGKRLADDSNSVVKHGWKINLDSDPKTAMVTFGVSSSEMTPEAATFAQK